VKLSARTKGERLWFLGISGEFAGTVGNNGETRESDLFSIHDELIGDYQDPQAITVTLHT
jgi:hypothetical protein